MIRALYLRLLAPSLARGSRPPLLPWARQTQMLCFSTPPTTKKEMAREGQTDGRTHGAPTNE